VTPWAVANRSGDGLDHHLSAERPLDGEQPTGAHRLVDQVDAVGEAALLTQHLVESAQEGATDGVDRHLEIGPTRIGAVDAEGAQADVGGDGSRPIDEPVMKAAPGGARVGLFGDRRHVPGSEGGLHLVEHGAVSYTHLTLPTN
jgi:hypothetical protein